MQTIIDCHNSGETGEIHDYYNWIFKLLTAANLIFWWSVLYVLSIEYSRHVSCSCRWFTLLMMSFDLLSLICLFLPCSWAIGAQSTTDFLPASPTLLYFQKKYHAISYWLIALSLLASKVHRRVAANSHLNQQHYTQKSCPEYSGNKSPCYTLIEHYLHIYRSQTYFCPLMDKLEDVLLIFLPLLL